MKIKRGWLLVVALVVCVAGHEVYDLRFNPASLNRRALALIKRKSARGRDASFAEIVRRFPRSPKSIAARLWLASRRVAVLDTADEAMRLRASVLKFQREDVIREVTPLTKSDDDELRLMAQEVFAHYQPGDFAKGWERRMVTLTESEGGLFKVGDAVHERAMQLLDVSATEPLTQPLPLAAKFDRMLPGAQAWSLDNTRVAFATQRQYSETLWVADLARGTLQSFLPSRRAKLWLKDGGEAGKAYWEANPYDGDAALVAWSADAKRVKFLEEEFAAP